MMLKCVLVVGLGSIGKRHARVVKQLIPDCEIIALRHALGSSSEEPAVDECVTSLSAALERAPQVAVIANPATHHVASAIPLAKAGVHLLIEKPLSNVAHDVPLLIETCRQRQVVLMTAYNMRFLPSLRHFRDLVRAGRVGRIFSVRAEVGQFLPNWRASSDYRQNVSAQSRLGGGVLLELSHEIDFLRWIFGEIEWVNATMLKQSTLEIDVEDTVHLIMGFEAEQQQAPLVASVDIDFIRQDTSRGCTAIGETGSLRWNALESSVEIYTPEAPGWTLVESFPVQRDESYISEWRHFLDCVHTGRQPEISGEDGLAVLRVIEAARLSSASGQRVRVTQA